MVRKPGNVLLAADICGLKGVDEVILMSKTGYVCTASFNGVDSKGTCDTECQWWHKEALCPCAKK